jgi:hypothetical protein
MLSKEKKSLKHSNSKGRQTMKTSMFVILFFLSILLFNSISAAQSQSMEGIHTDIDRAMMNENLAKLSMLLAKMSDVLDRGDMKSDHQIVSADILTKVSHMMVEMAGPSDKATNEKHQAQIKKLEKEWDPWAEMVDH